MNNIKFYEIQRTPMLIKTLLNIWEKSVRATHTFLSDDEISKIKEYVPQALNGVKHLVVAEVEPDKIVGFMGVQSNRLEMMFLLPSARGKGIGRKFLLHGIENYGVNELTVNEQNPQAVGFYRHMGFETYKRTALDEEGNPYPLLYMKLK